MKFIVLCGGLGSRLGVTTKVINKHLLPIGDLPMVAKPLGIAAEAGLTDALVISDCDSIGRFSRLAQEDVYPFNNLRCYFTTQSAPLGIANAIGCAKEFCHSGPVAVCLGDNWFSTYDVRRITERINAFKSGCEFWVKEVSDPRDYGVLELDEKGLASSVLEKPQNPPTNLAVVGMYLFDGRVWDIIKHLQPSARGEYEVADIINWYIKRGEARHRIIDGEWFDLGRSLASYFASANLEIL